jgi:hypothetical protein
MTTYHDPRNPIKGRGGARPAHGMARWLRRPNCRREGGLLEINRVTYEVHPLYDGDAHVGFRLLKAGTATMYDVDTTRVPWRCDCPDAVYNPERPGGCKHVSSLRAALDVLAKGGAA